MRRSLLVIVAVMASACQIGEATPVPPALVAIPTSAPLGEGDACMQALLTGRLVADDEAGLAVEAPDAGGERIVVVWPHGWVAGDHEGMRILLNDRGDEIARVGDQVEIGGGGGPDGRWYTCGEVTLAVP